MSTTEQSALDALYATGHWLYTERRFGDAIRVFHAFLFCAPTDERGWLALGACHEGLGATQVAHSIYVGATSAIRKSARCAFARARAARALGLFADSDAAYERAGALAADLDEHELLVAVNQERGES